MDDVVDTYEMSPMRQGMLFHALREHRTGVVIEQIIITLRESLDLATFEQVWADAIQRHPILRTRFRWKDVSEPCQEMLAQVESAGSTCESSEWERR